MWETQSPARLLGGQVVQLTAPGWHLGVMLGCVPASARAVGELRGRAFGSQQSLIKAIRAGKLGLRW
jgi:hypothetical protein